MGIEQETDRTLFIRNLDTRVTEELLFELFLQAGPLIKTKIPKDADGKQKTFGFAVYKHEVSVPYAMQLFDGSLLYGRTIHVQFRSGSSHSSSPGNSQNTSPGNTPNPHGQRTPTHFSSPPYTPPTQIQRSFSSPDSLQKHVMVNNMRWLHVQQLEQQNDGFSKPQQRQLPAGGNSGGGGSRQPDNAHYRHSAQTNSGGRNQRYAEEPAPGRHHHHQQQQQQQQQQGHNRDGYHHQKDWSGNRHHDNRGGNRHHDDKGSNRGYQDNRWRRY